MVTMVTIAGDHLQARKAELQSRAELHKARLDALNAKQRSTPSSAKPAALQPGVSPMTHKAIVDLTASPVALKQTTAPAAAAQTTAAAAAAPIPAATALPPALPVAAVSKPLTASQLERLTAADTTSAATAAPKPSTAIADKTEAVKLPTAKPATATISKDSKQRAQPAASQSTAARRLDKPASSKGAAGRSPTTSRQALKRRRSRSQSPAQRTGAGPRAGKTQPGGQRQAVTSSHRRPTRYDWRLMTLDLTNAYTGSLCPFSKTNPGIRQCSACWLLCIVVSEDVFAWIEANGCVC